MQIRGHQGARRRSPALAAMLAVGTALASFGVVGAQSPSFAPTPAPVGSLGTPEVGTVTLGYRLPSLNSVAALLVAQDRGFWQECGLDEVQLIQTEQVTAGVASGSLNFGLVETVDTGQAQLDGLPIKVVAGYRPYSRNVIAVRPEIATPADLAGKDILLGGTPGTRDFDVRFELLKENGFDLTGVPFNAVAVDGGSDAWVALLLEGKLAMTPIFNRHYDNLKAEGMQFWVDQQDFGSDHVTGYADFVAANPNTTAAFLCGLIKGIQVWSDPANKEYILGLGAATGIEITDGIRNAYELDIVNYKPFDGGWPLDLMVELFATNLDDGTVDLDELLALDPLYAAQAYLGLPLDPAPAQ
ncbi:MAG: ABC transporter substrate-binding protein [Chloroflexi bacterium]|nr:ABC transporter substrate-binding protein [Chloroflexota bacterium]